MTGPKQPDAPLEPQDGDAERREPRAPPLEEREPPPREAESESHGRGLAEPLFPDEERP